MSAPFLSAFSRILLIGLFFSLGCSQPSMQEPAPNPHQYLKSKIGRPGVVFLREDVAAKGTRVRGRLQMVTQGGILLTEKGNEIFVPFTSIQRLEFPGKPRTTSKPKPKPLVKPPVPDGKTKEASQAPKSQPPAKENKAN